ncbi:MAG: hypothetical protein M1824_000394 [Vezdaea acicularis]|nr:MAG: hypothetical protein M1824_000394 [Vezdaea acicularis]
MAVLSKAKLSSKALSDPGILRLHISPLNPQLLPSILPRSVLPLTEGISYHKLETFPERDYGFLELPAVEAEKLRKKLHGSIFKGMKMRIEKARPKKGQVDSEMMNESMDVDSKLEKPKKRKRVEGVILGTELEKGRKVQRGWTKPKGEVERERGKKDKKDRKQKLVPSEYTKGAELLFKTTLPPTVESPKTSKSRQRKTKGKQSRDVLVHEFEHTTKHASFLKEKTLSKDKARASEYVQGKGWVNENGDVVEEVKKNQRSNLSVNAQNITRSLGKVRDSATAPKEVTDRSESSSSERETSIEGFSDDGDKTSSEGNNSDTSGVESVSPLKPSQPLKSPTLTLRISKDVDGVNSEAVKKKPHPLETIFKLPHKPGNVVPLEQSVDESRPFSFFGEADDDIDESSQEVPMTPHSKLDTRTRGWRSAAPTPDTAAIGKFFPRFDPGIDDKDKTESTEEKGGQGGPQATPKPGNSIEDDQDSELDQVLIKNGKGFEERFYERRGETNRLWKRRRREAAKNKRKVDNKKHGQGGF